MTARIARLMRTIALVLPLLCIGLASPTAMAQQRIGISSAVNPAVMGISPGGQPRRLVLGQDVVFNERITTAAEGQTQVLFVDESTMTIGPNASMVIDQFVYDPNAGTGKLAASLTRGVFRFVGGKLSKEDNAVTMRTPAATIGIRGGVMLVDLSASGKLAVIFVYGNGVTITGLNGVAQTITRPGFEVTVSGPGASPSSPGLAPRGATAALLAQLDGRAGGHGGAQRIPTEVMVASSGIANAISANIAASIQAAARSGQRPPSQPQNVSAAVQLAQLNNQNVSVPAALQQGTLIPTPVVAPIVGPPTPPVIIPPSPPILPMPPVPPAPPSPPTPPVTATYAGNFKSTSGHGTTFGLLDPNGTTSNGLAYSGGTLSFPPGAPQNGVFTAALGSGGRLTIPLAPGAAKLPANGAGTASPAGPVTGTTYMAPDRTFFYANLTPLNAPNQREFIYGGQPASSTFYQAAGAARISAFNVQPDAALQSKVPFIRNGAGGNLPNAVVSPYYVAAPANVAFGDNLHGAARTTTLQASLAINSQGAKQRSVIVVQTGEFFTASDGKVAATGVVRGSSRLNPTTPPIRITSNAANVVDGLGGRIYGGKSISGFVLDQNGYNFSSNHVANQTASENAFKSPSTITTNYAFNQPVTPGTVPNGVGTNRTTQTFTGFFGGLQQTRTAANGISPPPYIVTGAAAVSTDPQTNRVAATLAGADPFTAGTSNVRSEVLSFGSLAGLSAGRSAEIDNSRFAAAEAPYNPANGQGTAPVVFDGRVLTFNGDPGQAGLLYLVSSGTVPSTALLPAGVSYCQCQYLQWGYWGGDIRGGTEATNTVRERAHINTWVAGLPTPVSDIVTLQKNNIQGIYNGALVGSVFNNGAQYLAAGGLQARYNFGTQIGSFKVVSYDGLNFTATGKIIPAGPGYAFGIKEPGLTGGVTGSFYGPMAAETGGTFAFKKTAGLPYFTSGVFAAKR